MKYVLTIEVDTKSPGASGDDIQLLMKLVEDGLKMPWIIETHVLSIRMNDKDTGPLSVVCPMCGVSINKKCISANTGRDLIGFHISRTKLARQVRQRS